MSIKTRVALLAMRKIAAEVLAVIEDYLDTPYDQSLLANRRRKVQT